MDNSESGVSRRTIVKGAAWSVPVIAVAVGTLVAAAGGLRGTFSTQIAYQATPFVNPPSGASLVVEVTFTSPVTLDPASSLGDWVPTPGAGSTGTTFTFIATPSGQGGSLSFNFIGTAAGSLTSTASMSLINGGTTTWASEQSSHTASLVA